jgi:hypothetical protein
MTENKPADTKTTQSISLTQEEIEKALAIPCAQKLIAMYRSEGWSDEEIA